MLPEAQSRPAAQISQPLHNNLALYALAAGATGVSMLALGQTAECEVVYTPVHEIIGRNQTFAIDLNHDGIADFTISNSFTGSPATLVFTCKQYSALCLTPAVPSYGPITTMPLPL
jgi:hypothetical protein